MTRQFTDLTGMLSIISLVLAFAIEYFLNLQSAMNPGGGVPIFLAPLPPLLFILGIIMGAAFIAGTLKNRVR